jgi:2-hydroxychromene-2-carboxylate isomerase
MKQVVFHFDVISPFAYLAFERLPEALQGCNVAVEYRPVLFAGLLQHWQNKGPAEIEPKRAWTFRHVAWLAQHHGIPLNTPAVHPFNPLALLRLILACGPNRRVVQAVMQHVWLGGGDPGDPTRLAALAASLAPTQDQKPDANSDAVKQALRNNTQAAIDAGLFGVPTFEVDGRQFWGLDALPMLREAVLGAQWFDGPDWRAAGTAPPGIKR